MNRRHRITETQRRRLAFTLLELLIVLSIIGILTALLFTGINAAIASARVTGVVTEMKNFEKAIADFKLEYGIEPPSYFVFFEDGEHWAESDTHGGAHPNPRRSREILRKLWPNFLGPGNIPTGGTHDDDGDGIFDDIDLNGDGDRDDVHIFNGAECLVFFLGGVCRDLTDLNGDGTNDYVAYGFSTNPANPFAVDVTSTGVVSSNRVQFFDFDPDRFVNVDGDPTDPDADDLPEYIDQLPSQSMPYLYFSSYDGAGYRPYGIDGIPNSPAPPEGPDDETPIDINGNLVGIGDIYYQQAPSAGPPVIPGVYWNQDSYQIISPGFDREYGAGGFYNGNSASTLEERDNITNFKGGVLN